jgi:hypothetical protein
MCDECKKMDGQIDHYRTLAGWINDQKTLDGIEQLIRELETRKKALHPEEQSRLSWWPTDS